MINRDNAYLNYYQPYANLGTRHDYRNSNIDNYVAAAEYLCKKGNYVIRMGVKTEKQIKINDKNFIEIGRAHV